ncbi:MAG: ABC transporter ATP-binding protein [Alphaproteobacteria bacterium]|nr:ABC transporter ATP-binding protein [Alphaproteobacteria bacterium]
MLDSSFVKLDGVAVEYGRGATATRAVDHVSLDVAEGEFVALVGPSGCGKSTLLKLVSGLLPPTRGVASVDGAAVTAPLKIVGMAFQSATMLPWLRTIDNILLPLKIVEPHRQQFRAEKSANLDKAMELLRRVGLDGFEDRYPWELSGGMQQRASLCRALIHDPRLLLLDEPFGALDAFTREELWQVLQNLWFDRKPTVLLVTHDLREALFLADRVIVMSARPGVVIHDQRVGFKRPRSLHDLYTGEAGAQMEELRSKIDHRSLVGEETA